MLVHTVNKKGEILTLSCPNMKYAKENLKLKKGFQETLKRGLGLKAKVDEMTVIYSKENYFISKDT